MLEFKTIRNYGRDEWLYEVTSNKELTLDEFLNKYRGEYGGTPHDVRIFNKRYFYQKDVFNSSNYDTLDDLNVDELRPLIIKHIYAVGGWGPIIYYIRLA